MKYTEEKLSITRLKELVTYNPETGIFTFNSTRGGNLSGDIAGSLHHLGYVFLMIDRETYTAHRLAWFYCFEEWPTKFIDHIDKNRSNNRLDNLREASREENACNMKIRKDNTTGYKGVSLDKKTGRFMSRLTVNKKVLYLGMFKTAEEASKAREDKAKELQGDFYG